jgi:hypothetical protein
LAFLRLFGEGKVLIVVWLLWFGKVCLLESRFKATMVSLIMQGDTEKALEMLAEHYRVSVPRLKVGLPKGKKRNSLGCYSPKNKTITVLNSDTLKQPFVILHEFYHHLRTNVFQQHKGTEKGADAFARDYIQAYETHKALSGNDC